MPINFPDLVQQVSKIDTVEDSALLIFNETCDQLLNINDPMELLHFAEELRKYSVPLSNAIAANITPPKS